MLPMKYVKFIIIIIIIIIIIVLIILKCWLDSKQFLGNLNHEWLCVNSNGWFKILSK